VRKPPSFTPDATSPNPQRIEARRGRDGFDARPPAPLPSCRSPRPQDRDQAFAGQALSRAANRRLATDRGRDAPRKIVGWNCCGLRRLHAVGHRRHKDIAAPRNIRDVSRTVAPVSGRASHGLDIDREVGLADLTAGPNQIHELPLGEDFTGSLHQRDKKREGTPTDRDEVVALPQSTAYGERLKGAERDHTAAPGDARRAVIAPVASDQALAGQSLSSGRFLHSGVDPCPARRLAVNATNRCLWRRGPPGQTNRDPPEVISRPSGGLRRTKAACRSRERPG
jgi:hypothetical protein